MQDQLRKRGFYLTYFSWQLARKEAFNFYFNNLNRFNHRSYLLAFIADALAVDSHGQGGVQANFQNHQVLR